jgi:hypothetical protein
LLPKEIYHKKFPFFKQNEKNTTATAMTKKCERKSIKSYGVRWKQKKFFNKYFIICLSPSTRKFIILFLYPRIHVIPSCNIKTMISDVDIFCFIVIIIIPARNDLICAFERAKRKFSLCRHEK